MAKLAGLRWLWAAAIACGAAASGAHAAGYEQVNLIANQSSYAPRFVDRTLVNAWGIAIRPAGFGGHFWVTSNAGGGSDQYIGDVAGEVIGLDELHRVRIPGPRGPGSPTGVVFNPGTGFEITQPFEGGAIHGPARFLFVGSDGVLSAWTERDNGDGSFDRPLEARVIHDRSRAGSAYFGLAIHPSSRRLYAADFGAAPGIAVWNGAFRDVSRSFPFPNPFAAEDGVAGLQPGDYAPFNVQAIGDRIFVAFAKTRENPERPGRFFAGEEEAGAGFGRIAEYRPDGALVATWNHGDLLNAPWGFALAPEGFGEFSGALLVSNFGDGTVTAFDPETRTALGHLRDPSGAPIQIEGIWGIVFGNGASLGEANQLYFAAGPADELDGLFGKLVAHPD